MKGKRVSPHGMAEDAATSKSDGRGYNCKNSVDFKNTGSKKVPAKGANVKGGRYS